MALLIDALIEKTGETSTIVDLQELPIFVTERRWPPDEPRDPLDPSPQPSSCYDPPIEGSIINGRIDAEAAPVCGGMSED